MTTLPTTISIPQVARDALVDDRTVRRALRGMPMRPSTRRRVERALRRLGVELPGPPPAGARDSEGRP